MLRWDRALRLYCDAPGATIKILAGVLGSKFKQSKAVNQVFFLASSVLSHFWTTRVKPFLVLPGPVEIDETKVTVLAKVIDWSRERSAAWTLRNTSSL